MIQGVANLLNDFGGTCFGKILSLLFLPIFYIFDLYFVIIFRVLPSTLAD